MDKLLMSLGPVFAAGLGIQQGLELLDSILLGRILSPDYKKVVLGLISLSLGLGLAYGLPLHALKDLGLTIQREWLDPLVTGLIISGGTQGINSLVKFLGYAKEGKKAEAAGKTEAATVRGQDVEKTARRV